MDGWKAAGRRTHTGDLVELKTLPGYHVRPRKFSIGQADTIRELAAKQGTALTPALSLRVAKAQEDAAAKFGADATVQDTLNFLTPEDGEEFLTSLLSSGATEERLKKIMLWGVAEHDLTDEDGAVVEWGDALMDALMEFPDTAMEIAKIVQEFNAPLRRRSAPGSKR